MKINVFAFALGISGFVIAGLTFYLAKIGLLYPVIAYICVPVIVICGIINLIVALR